jgi:hypothetical protein
MNKREATPAEREKHRDTYNWRASDLQVALHSLKMTIVHDARDWGATNRDARIYALAVGWDNTSYVEMQRKHGWTDETVAVLKKRHAAIHGAAGKFPSELVQW